MIPENFGRYRVTSEIARGGMGTVYRARDPRIGREVAVKVLSRDLSDDPTFLARFEREAQTIASLEHPAIVPIYDFGEQDGQPYLVMRFMEGGSLQDLIARGPLSLDRSMPILDRVVAALQHAHDHGVVHRDLKPPNIFFDAGSNAYLGDFGIVRLRQDVTTLTQAGAVIGSPAYMSPEQVQAGKELDGRSDIYSLGVILFEMLSGMQPYRAETPAKLMMQHILDPVPQLTGVAPGLAPDCDVIVSRAMAKSPEERYQTPRAMVEDLTTLATQGSLAAISPTLLPSEPDDGDLTPRPIASPDHPPSHTPPSASSPDRQPSQTPPPASSPDGPPAETLIDGERPHRWVHQTGVLAAAALALLVVGLGAYGLLFSRGGGAPVPTSAPTPGPSAQPATAQPARSPSAQPTPSPTVPAAFYDLRFCDRPCGVPGAVDIGSVPEGSETVYVAWSYQGMLPGTRYTRTWSVLGSRWVHYECEWQGPLEGTMEVTLREPEGLRSGPWKVSLRVEDGPAIESTVMVEGTNSFWDPAGERPCPDTP